jgi:hypothetical protein
MPRQSNDDPHDIALACVTILDAMSKQKTFDDTSAAASAELRQLAANYPDPDPFAGSTVVEITGHYARSWHGAICKLATDWGARLPVSWADIKQRGQTLVSPQLWPDAEWLRLRLEAEVQARLAASGIGKLDQPFIPTPHQRKVLKLLNGKALKLAQIEQLTGIDATTLSKRVLGELKKQDLVRHSARIGYYRPDKPPPDLTGV